MSRAVNAGRGRLDLPRNEFQKPQRREDRVVVPIKRGQTQSSEEIQDGFVLPKERCANPGCSEISLAYGFVTHLVTRVIGQVCSRRCNTGFYEQMFTELSKKMTPASRPTKVRKQA